MGADVGSEWGVWFEGSSVVLVTDGLSAFRVERAMRAVGWADAVAVWRPVGATVWWPVGPGDVRRPSPAPPPQATGWLEVWRRRGRKAVQFRRRTLR